MILTSFLHPSVETDSDFNIASYYYSNLGRTFLLLFALNQHTGYLRGRFNRRVILDAFRFLRKISHFASIFGKSQDKKRSSN